MTRFLPPLATLLGLGGLIPFVACGYAAIGERLVVAPAFGLAALIGYAVSILAFLGAVHWGFALADARLVPGASAPGERGRVTTRRLVGGILPALIAWGALLVGWPAARPDGALALLALGFVLVAAAEARAARVGEMPIGYWRLRLFLTAVVVVVLVTVMVVRLAGVRLGF